MLIEYRPTECHCQNNPKQGLLGIIYIFHDSVEKNNFVSIPDMRQSKTLLIIDERESEIALTSVFDCQLSPVGRLMPIQSSVSNYFWSTFVDILTFSIAVYLV